MIYKTLLVTALLALSAGASAADSAIKVSVDKGSVLVNQGKQFVSAKAGQSVSPGDRVMVMAGGQATITYPNGCVATVPAGSMIDVNAGCSTKSAKKVGIMYAQAVGDTEDCKRRANDDDKNNDCHLAGDVDDGGHPPFWAVFGGWAAITCVALVCNHHADGISLP